VSARGVRFAPSPTGRFHVGNLRTAWISWRWARRLGEPWAVRFEDIDRPRVLPGALEQQLADLSELGLVPDARILQSQRRERHWEVFLSALREGRIYPCVCSRQEVTSALSGLASAPQAATGSAPEAPVYSGACRGLGASELRCRLGELRVQRRTGIGWRFRQPDPSGRDDFLVARTSPPVDGGGVPDEPSFTPAYHWACAIDDYDGDYRLLVRAGDLASATPIQRAVQSFLGLGSDRREWAPPAVFHCSLVTRDDGGRLEKRTKDVTLPELRERGIGVARLLELFELSFDEALLEPPPGPGSIIGERAEKLLLSELGIA
jgi:glutamyl-tRNA synthetase